MNGQKVIVIHRDAVIVILGDGQHLQDEHPQLVVLGLLRRYDAGFG